MDKEHKRIVGGLNHQSSEVSGATSIPTPLKHGEEGTHYVCDEILKRDGGKAKCCGCEGHKCKETPPPPQEPKGWEDQLNMIWRRGHIPDYANDVRTVIKSLISSIEKQAYERGQKHPPLKDGEITLKFHLEEMDNAHKIGKEQGRTEERKRIREMLLKYRCGKHKKILSFLESPEETK